MTASKSAYAACAVSLMLLTFYYVFGPGGDEQMRLARTLLGASFSEFPRNYAVPFVVKSGLMCVMAMVGFYRPSAIISIYFAFCAVSTTALTLFLAADYPQGLDLNVMRLEMASTVLAVLAMTLGLRRPMQTAAA